MAVSGFATWRILSPLQAVSRSTRRLAEGAYDQRIDPPAEPELAALANDVNALAGALPSTEQPRIHLISEVAFLRAVVISLVPSESRSCQAVAIMPDLAPRSRI